ncbi:cytochrome b/b6 domain-containing protein [Nocardia noduli]|uniref:cytochrome b/b6 domain-containing protein n=1 Tax=Nocardia noduli TaxID=2815722 RepID=UPI001C23105E|nr:cytochrome b/b6 domain-containing protein [Nocardia noduli]
MTRPAESGAVRLHRFGRVERAVHWLTGLLVVSCVVTAAILYNGPLAVLVGNRHIVETVHVWSGFALPIPLVAGLVSAAYRADLRRLNRFTPADYRWLRSRTRRRSGADVGKFNAGQKLNAALSAGSILVLLGTGVIMFFPDWTRLTWRTGATFVHDWFALAFGLLVAGHLVYALRDREAMRGMLVGTVSKSWATREHMLWAARAESERRDR